MTYARIVPRFDVVFLGGRKKIRFYSCVILMRLNVGSAGYFPRRRVSCAVKYPGNSEMKCRFPNEMHVVLFRYLECLNYYFEKFIINSCEICDEKKTASGKVKWNQYIKLNLWKYCM